MAEDKKTIGLTDSGKATMEQMVEVVGFKRDMDAAKFAFAFAVEQGCEPGPIEGTGTIWNVGTLDEGGDLKALIQNLYPQTQFPYRALESLMDTGFGLLAKEMASASGLRIERILQRATDAAKGSQPG
ncbi:hypothetical protein [Edaphobacter modestus]|uniref:Tail assembly chaperone n=1 Tax=Edaphobacter modestus TaxID=388466 RepID=A0A4Q7Y0V0_9BACT|nr:hypothetical protein [Edaphobacter modestus]RZU30370.1 hypothetical protein BDD14_6158 [Edaphobacter modestus]